MNVDVSAHDVDSAAVGQRRRAARAASLTESESVPVADIAADHTADLQSDFVTDLRPSADAHPGTVPHPLPRRRRSTAGLLMPGQGRRRACGGFTARSFLCSPPAAGAF